jgi:hypothetical protein
MRSPVRPAKLHAMVDMRASETIRLAIELERGAEPIEGRLTAPDGHEVPFRGWLLLTTLIESARNDGLDPAGPGASHDPACDRPGSPG